MGLLSVFLRGLGCLVIGTMVNLGLATECAGLDHFDLVSAHVCMKPTPEKPHLVVNKSNNDLFFLAILLTTASSHNILRSLYKTGMSIGRSRFAMMFLAHSLFERSVKALRTSRGFGRFLKVFLVPENLAALR